MINTYRYQLLIGKSERKATWKIWPYKSTSSCVLNASDSGQAQLTYLSKISKAHSTSINGAEFLK